MLDFKTRFHIGVNIDDTWRYAGLPEPKSVIIPYVLSVRIPEGTVFERADNAIYQQFGIIDPEVSAKEAAESLARDLAEVRADFVRCWFNWRFFEPSPVPAEALDSLLETSYEKWPLDDLVNTLTSKGVEIVPVIGCGYERMLPEGLHVDKDRKLYLKRVAIHARLIIRRYKDRVKHWQIENEPNWWRKHVDVGWRTGVSWLDPRGFREELLKTLNEAAHEEDSRATTIINLEGDEEEAKEFSAYPALCDIVGLDFYPNYKASSPINTSVFTRAHEFSKATGKPVIISETGYPSGPRLLGYTEEKQALYVTKACEKAYSLEGVNGIGIWRHKDTSWRSFPPQENRFGLKDSKGDPKPAWDALKNSVSTLR